MATLYPYRREIRPSLEMSLGEHTDREYEKIERSLLSLLEELNELGVIDGGLPSGR